MHQPESANYASVVANRSSRWLHLYACFMVAATLLLIFAGGMVTSTGSGLAVPDWPTTYGQNMFTYPYEKWVGGIFYEHGHRLIASAVGFLTIILAVWTALVERRRWVEYLAWSALGLVILQGVLGGLTVIYLLPTPISVFHGCLAQIFLCTLVAIAVFTSAWWKRGTTPAATPSFLSAPACMAALVLALFVQLILGAMMRHSMKDLGSGLAVPDFPRAYGQWTPSLSDSSIEQYNYDRRTTYNMAPVAKRQIVYHMLHRFWALVVTGVCLTTSLLVLKRHPRIPALTRPAVLLLVLLASQWLLGAFTIWSGRNPLIASSHVLVGACTLATGWMLLVRSSRCLCTEQIESVSPAWQGAAA
jgi:cytochrome c oxidase assembly protein subunit 15